ncbi:MAG TPA: hypothetical protein PKW55_05355 [Spirochaetota bacterium]|nr:hypothetical protein [Spirochaetota bacterium]HPQ49408.1 hypothetical protein [Spirochaetota bacterium]
MDIKFDPNFEIKKIFTYVETIVFLRKDINREDKNLISFFSDFFNTSVVENINDIKDCELLNINDENIIGVLKNKDIKNIWIEKKSDARLIRKGLVEGDMKKFYSKNFLDTCSA